MSQQELLRKVIQALDSAGIEYMISGSMASSLQGEPRSTHDIDIVVAIERASARKLAEAFSPPDYYLDEQSIIEAIGGNGMFNLTDVNSGDKVDFWVLTDEPFDRSRFARGGTSKKRPACESLSQALRTQSWRSSDGPGCPRAAKSSSQTHCEFTKSSFQSWT